MRTIFFEVPMRLPDENQLMALLKQKYATYGKGPGRLSAYTPYRKEVLDQTSLLINSYFHKLRKRVPHIYADERCRFRFDWYEADRKRDPDNVTAGGRKIILDAMQAIGMWPTDGARAYVTEGLCMMDAFHYGYSYVGVQVFVQLFVKDEGVTPV